MKNELHIDLRPFFLDAHMFYSIGTYLEPSLSALEQEKMDHILRLLSLEAMLDHLKIIKRKSK